MSVNFKNSHSITDNYLRELGSDHPFGRIYCQTRTMQPTVCDGTCGGCKKKRDEFLESEVQRQFELEKNNPKYGPGADQESTPNTRELEQVIRTRVNRAIGEIEQKKGEIVQLIVHTNERMKLIEKQLLSPNVSTTLQ